MHAMYVRGKGKGGEMQLHKRKFRWNDNPHLKNLNSHNAQRRLMALEEFK